MQRKQFTFYQSYWDAVQNLPKRDQLSFFKALCSYALEGEEISLTGSAAAAFFLVKPVLDTAWHRAGSGKQGGSKPKANAKQTESKTEANAKQNESEKEGEVENEGEIEVEVEGENECYPPSPSGDGDCPPAGGPPAGGSPHGADASPGREVPCDDGQAVAAVVRAVGELGLKGRAELNGFLRDMGPGCVLRALDAARDAGKLSWSYVRGVLRYKRNQGVASLADWDKIEASFQGAKAAAVKGAKGTIAGTPRCVQPSPDRARENSQWLEEFLAGQEAAGG